MKYDDEPALKSVDSIGAENPAQVGQGDSSRKGRGPAPTVLLARTGLAVANGATSMGAAMVEAGYSPETAKNPTANGCTMPRVLAAAEAMFSGSPTVHTLKRKSLAAIDAALDDADLPSFPKAQVAGAFLKHAAEAGEPEATGNAARHAWRQRKGLRRAFAAALRCVEINGLDAARGILEEIEARDVGRFPYPVELVAVTAPDWTNARARARDANRTRREEE